MPLKPKNNNSRRRSGPLAPPEVRPARVLGGASLTGALFDCDSLVGELCMAISDLHDPGEVERHWELRSGKTGGRVRLRERLPEARQCRDRTRGLSHCPRWLGEGNMAAMQP